MRVIERLEKAKFGVWGSKAYCYNGDGPKKVLATNRNSCVKSNPLKSGEVRKELINMEIPLNVFQAKTQQKVHGMKEDF